ncbi:MAG TPA: DUF899 domain-containing protein [Acidimicrobiales bacterium]
MQLPEVVSREQWLVARKELLEREKELVDQRDRLSADRRRLPMVEIEKPYTFEGPEGVIGLLDMFDGRRQLIVQHFMFDPNWDEGCPSCTAGSDELSDGLFEHLHSRDTSFAAISRAPLAKLEEYKAKRGWTFPWYSSFGTDFNYDFGVTFDESVTPIEINYRTREELERPENAKLHWLLQQEQPFENPGVSTFLRDGDRVFHTYFTTGRGAEWTGGSYAFLDLTALGRQEVWEEPKGRVDAARDAVPSFED